MAKFKTKKPDMRPAFILYALPKEGTNQLTRIGQFYEGDDSANGYGGEITCLPVDPSAYSRLFLAKYSAIAGPHYVH